MATSDVIRDAGTNHGNCHDEVEQMLSTKADWFATHFAGEFAESNNRSCKGNCANKCTDEQFNFLCACMVVSRIKYRCHCDQHSRQTNEGVHERNELWHLGHLYTFCS